VALLGARHERRRALGGRARVLAPRQGQRREPDQGGKARSRSRQPPLPRLPPQLGLPPDHPARLQPAHLAEAPRPPRGRAVELRQAAALPFHRRRRQRAAPAGDSSSVSPPVTRSWPTSSERSSGSAGSPGRPPSTPPTARNSTPLAFQAELSRETASGARLDSHADHRRLQPCRPRRLHSKTAS
jgi:hypothetical protein